MIDMLRNYIQEVEQGIIGGLLVNLEILVYLDLMVDDFLSLNYWEMFDVILFVVKYQLVDLVIVGQYLEFIIGCNWLVILSDMVCNMFFVIMVLEYVKIL